MENLAHGTIVKMRGNNHSDYIGVIEHMYKGRYVIRYWMEGIDCIVLGAKEIYSRLERGPEDIIEIYPTGTEEYQSFNLKSLEIARETNRKLEQLLDKDKHILYPCGDKFGSRIDRTMNHIHSLWLIENLPRIVREQDERKR